MATVSRKKHSHDLYIKWLCTIMTMVLLLICTSALGEAEWYCPECGRLNHDNFCPADGTERPSMEEEAERRDNRGLDQQSEAVPVLSETYPGRAVKLKYLENGGRAQSYTGPGKSYVSSGGYKTQKLKTVTVFFVENGWVLTDYGVNTREEKYIYFERASFDDVTAVPTLSTMPRFNGTILESIDPKWGPGSQFKTVDYYHATAGTSIKVFFQENGYVYGEYQSVTGLARMWFPAESVAVPGMSLTYMGAAEENSAESDYGHPRGSGSSGSRGSVTLPEDGSWSEWTDTPMSFTDVEVRTRTVYRVKYEILDWTDWIDGDVPFGIDEEDSDVETREVWDENGIFKRQWRKYGAHYHYDEWSEWKEEIFRSSSSDIIEEKIQYSYRRLH